MTFYTAIIWWFDDGVGVFRLEDFIFLGAVALFLHGILPVIFAAAAVQSQAMAVALESQAM